MIDHDYQRYEKIHHPDLFVDRIAQPDAKQPGGFLTGCDVVMLWQTASLGVSNFLDWYSLTGYVTSLNGFGQPGMSFGVPDDDRIMFNGMAFHLLQPYIPDSNIRGIPSMIMAVQAFVGTVIIEILVITEHTERLGN
jgi:hypothetical protein